MLNLIFMNILLLLPMSSYSCWFSRLFVLMIGSLNCLFYVFSFSMSFDIVSMLTLMDGLNKVMVGLSWWISFLMLMSSQFSVKSKNKNFLSFSWLVCVLNFVLMATFLSSDLVVFYFFFEASLIPTLFLIIGWGYQPERLQAGFYLMLYTITVSLPFLVWICVWFYDVDSKFIIILNMFSFKCFFSFFGEFVGLVMILAFLVKLPLFGFHLWLPKAHVEAPVAGSMILAGVLLKLGGYGLLRVMMISNLYTLFSVYLIMVVGIWGGFLTCLICLRQIDLKALIAYSSVSHMGILVAGILSGSLIGWQGALIMMFAHGFCSSALFSLANIYYEKLGTRNLYLMKGMLCVLPFMAMWWFLFCINNMAAPPSINLMSEILLFFSVGFKSLIFVLLISFVTFFSAIYNLYMYIMVHHGSVSFLGNSFSLVKHCQYLLLFIHIVPIYLFILKSELIVEWLI
uniref:NADH-ubiquinone oxidoreductase chain 4 n=1 Tax=Pleuropoma jana TaxID=1882665 RepID=A0A1B2G3B0_9GAST|nr:NADH dehydrogenase subunit 4 [Pleuropoma jana]